MTTHYGIKRQKQKAYIYNFILFGIKLPYKLPLYICIYPLLFICLLVSLHSCSHSIQAINVNADKFISKFMHLGIAHLNKTLTNYLGLASTKHLDSTHDHIQIAATIFCLWFDSAKGGNVRFLSWFTAF